jgi:IS30 family transposase
VTARLKAKDSPMTIAVELANGLYPDVGRTVSHETIYASIYDFTPCGLPVNIHKNLHRRHRFRKHRHGRQRRPHWRNNLPSISTRPTIASSREEVGHFEGDLIIGKANQSAIITVFDRASRHLWMADLPNGRDAHSTLAALTKLLKRIPPQHRHTLTWDQGGEMALYAKLSKRCKIGVYFADPHSPWQRPTNENGNGLIRRYVGKATDLSVFKPADLRAIENRINTTPRRVLNWTTAKHVYDQTVAMTT